MPPRRRRHAAAAPPPRRRRDAAATPPRHRRGRRRRVPPRHRSQFFKDISKRNKVERSSGVVAERSEYALPDFGKAEPKPAAAPEYEALSSKVASSYE